MAQMVHDPRLDTVIRNYLLRHGELTMGYDGRLYLQCDELGDLVLYLKDDPESLAEGRESDERH